MAMAVTTTWAKAGELVYLAGPIETAADHNPMAWREEASKLLKTEGVATLCPARALHGVRKKHASQVNFLNRSMIEACTAVLARLGGFQTVREIEFAVMSGLPVFLWVDNRDYWSVGFHDLKLSYDLEEAVRQVVEWSKRERPWPNARQ
jgi:nucleoside 2-deoxyribosyltransferase